MSDGEGHAETHNGDGEAVINNKRSRMDAGLGEELSAAEKKESIRRYLQAYSRDQLLNIIVDLGANQQAAYAEIVRVACDDLTNRKLFVRGINWNTTNEALQAAFSEFGDVDEALIVTDKATGKSKGFGFVIFTSGESAFAALARRTLVIDGRSVQFNLASLRNDQPALGIGPGGALAFNAGGPSPGIRASASGSSFVPYSNPASGGMGVGVGGGGYGGGGGGSLGAGGGEDISLRKIFVRGLNWETTNEALRQAFEIYGPVEEAAVVMDKVMQRSKGFGFVTFVSAAACAKALESPQKEIQGRMTSCNLASDGKVQGGGGGGGGGMSQFGAARPAYGSMDAGATSYGAGAGAQATYNAYQYGQQAAGYGAGGYQQQQQQQAVYAVPAQGAYSAYGAQAAQQVQQAAQQQQAQAYTAAYGYAASAARK